MNFQILFFLFVKTPDFSWRELVLYCEGVVFGRGKHLCSNNVQVLLRLNVLLAEFNPSSKMTDCLLS